MIHTYLGELINNFPEIYKLLYTIDFVSFRREHINYCLIVVASEPLSSRSNFKPSNKSLWCLFTEG